MRSASRFQPLLVLAALAVPATGCSDPGFDPDAVTPVRDPSADDTPPDAPFLPGQRRDVGDAHAVFDHQVPNDALHGVTMPGDLDGDGLGDLLIWGEISNDREIVPCHAGCPGFEQVEVQVIYGSPALGHDGSLRPDAVLRSWHINGVRMSVDGAGDVDGDGLADVVVGVGSREEEQGSAFVIHGGPRLAGVHDLRDVGALVREQGNGTHFGEVAGLGDVDGDGYDDVGIGAPGFVDESQGRLYVYYGRPDAPPARRTELDADASFSSAGGHRFGLAQRAGDVDGDGRADFLLHEVLEVGTVVDRAWWLVLGRAARFGGTTDIASVATRIDAATVHGVGDLDGDGRDELGASVAGGTRDAFVLAGRAEWPDRVDPREAGTWIEREAEIDPVIGSSGPVALPAGDVNGDGLADLLYGDPTYDPEGTVRGAVYLFPGAIASDRGALALDESTAFLGQDWLSSHDDSRRGYDHLGEAIASGSDLNGDGIDDLALAGLDAADGGRVYLWLGRGAE